MKIKTNQIVSFWVYLYYEEFLYTMNTTAATYNKNMVRGVPWV